VIGALATFGISPLPIITGYQVSSVVSVPTSSAQGLIQDLELRSKTLWCLKETNKAFLRNSRPKPLRCKQAKRAQKGDGGNIYIIKLG